MEKIVVVQPVYTPPEPPRHALPLPATTKIAHPTNLIVNAAASSRYKLNNFELTENLKDMILINVNSY